MPEDQLMLLDEEYRLFRELVAPPLNLFLTTGILGVISRTDWITWIFNTFLFYDQTYSFSTLFCTRINNIVTFIHIEAKTNSLKHFNERLLTRQALSMMLANRYKWIPTLELVADVINRVCRRHYEKHFQQQKCDPKCIAHSSKTLEEQLSLNFCFNHFNSCFHEYVLPSNISVCFCKKRFLFHVQSGFIRNHTMGPRISCCAVCWFYLILFYDSCTSQSWRCPPSTRNTYLDLSVWFLTVRTIL